LQEKTPRQIRRGVFYLSAEPKGAIPIAPYGLASLNINVAEDQQSQVAPAAFSFACSSFE